MEGLNPTNTNQLSSISVEPDLGLERETSGSQQDEAAPGAEEQVVDQDDSNSTTTSNSESDSPIAGPVQDEPEGTLVHEFFSRKAIRHGDKVIKINREGIEPSEAEVVRFVRERTTISVPRVHAVTRTSITMDFVEGTTLHEAWNGLSDTARATISAQLRDYINQLRAIKGSYVGGFGRGPALDLRHFRFEGGPFDTEAEYNDFVLADLLPACPPVVRSMAHSQLRTDHDIVFTHGDLNAKNIMVRDGRVVAIIDWETAGFYPEYIELVKLLRGPEWRVGYYSALVLDIFPRRYDAEYIADQFISRISRR